MKTVRADSLYQPLTLKTNTIMYLKTDCTHHIMWSAETDKNIYLVEQDKVSNEFTYSLNGYTLSKPCRTHLKMMAHFNLPSPKQTIISILADGEVINLNFAQGNIGKCIKSIKASLTCEFTVIGARVFTIAAILVVLQSCGSTKHRTASSANYYKHCNNL